ncbi:MAG: hypothetical protein IIY37_06205, partial [Selenomonadaceae bacterium]|nr:hypothetical protein [Selenomonadaceae bacterium]
MTGTSSKACFRASGVITPIRLYSMIRNVFSAMNTALMLALNSSAVFVTLPTYAASRAPIPNSPHRSPERIPITPNRSFDSFIFEELFSRKNISTPI